MASTPSSVSWPPRSTRPYCSCPASALSSPASFWSPAVTTRTTEQRAAVRRTLELNPSPSRRVSISGTGSRGDDRTANSAIHRIVLVRMSAGDTRTVDYIARRTAKASPSARSSAASNASSREVFNLIRNSLPVNSGTGQRRRTLAIPISTVATALAVPYQRIRRLEIGQRLDPDLAATYSRWLTDREQQSSSLSLADTA